jgi:NAD(P)-dependent dehydrogenase (short-subunit alcohol dehydrogenase family)
VRDKVVLVTGGGTGIGKAIAQRFVRLNAFVAITGRRESQLAETCKELGANASYIAGDLTKCGVAKNTIREVVKKYGHLDVLINNAAAAKHGLLVDVPDEDIDFLLRTNVFAPLALIREALPELPKTGGVDCQYIKYIDQRGNAGSKCLFRNESSR